MPSHGCGNNETGVRLLLNVSGKSHEIAKAFAVQRPRKAVRDRLLQRRHPDKISTKTTVVDLELSTRGEFPGSGSPSLAWRLAVNVLKGLKRECVEGRLTANNEQLIFNR